MGKTISTGQLVGRVLILAAVLGVMLTSSCISL
jgi:hypothetical protein